MTFLRRAWPVVLGLSLVPFGGWAAVRLLGAEQGAPWMQLMSFTPYVAGASLVPLAAALVSRRWRHAGAAAVLAAVLASLVVPRAMADDAGLRRPGPTVRVVTANLLLGGADPVTLVGIVRDHRADVLAVQELTPAGAAALDDAGLGTLLPYRAAYPAPGSQGSALYSRYPLKNIGVRQMPAQHLQAYGTLLVPGARPVLVESAHPCAPSDPGSTDQWAREIALQPRATPSGPARILLGDFNSTLDHEGLRRLVGSGYTDAASAVGAGLRPTWSATDLGRLGHLLPPVTIDHVLVDRRIGVRTVAVHPLPRSDHRAVYADLVLPPA